MVKKINPSDSPYHLKHKVKGLAKDKGLDKKSLLYLIIAITVIVLVCLGLIYYHYFLKPKPEEELEKEPGREEIIKQQLQGLEQARENIQPLTEEEIQKQLEELNKLR